MDELDEGTEIGRGPPESHSVKMVLFLREVDFVELAHLVIGVPAQSLAELLQGMRGAGHHEGFGEKGPTRPHRCGRGPAQSGGPVAGTETGQQGHQGTLSGKWTAAK